MHVDAQRQCQEKQLRSWVCSRLCCNYTLCPRHTKRVLQSHWQAVLWPGRPPLLCLISCLPRYGNPTTRVLEEKIAALEGAEDCVVGMGALGAAAVRWPCSMKREHSWLKWMVACVDGAPKDCGAWS